MHKGYAVQLWEKEYNRRNQRLLRFAVLLVVAAVLLVCSAHAQTGGGGVVTHPPTAQQQITWGIGGAAAGNAVGAAICTAFSAGACAAGFGTGAAILGGIDWALNYQNLPDGEYVMPGFDGGGFSGGGAGGGGGKLICRGCKKSPSGVPSAGGGGGSFAAKLTVLANAPGASRSLPYRFDALRLPGTPSRLRNAFTTYTPRFDWRSTAVTALQSNVLAPRYKVVLPAAAHVVTATRPVQLQRVRR